MRCFMICLFSITCVQFCSSFTVRGHSINKRDIPSKCGEQSVTPLLEQEKKVKLHNRRPRVVGGDESNAHSWPWQVIIYVCSKAGLRCQMVCGGTLVSSQSVITAAHCVFFGKLPPVQIKIRIGAHMLLESSNGEQNVTVDRYATGKFVTQDIAVLHLANAVTFSDTISPACLPSTDLPADTTCYVIGWGEFKNNVEEPSPVLRQAPQKIQKYNVCRKAMPMFDDDSEICANWKRGVDSCYGDSGGPLLCMVDDKWELHGIISFGRRTQCGKAPGYYTKVMHYKKWILDHL